MKPIEINPQIRELLETPTWSVASLIRPDKGSPGQDGTETEAEEPEVTREKLHHLLRLSALPPPADKGEEDKMLDTLAQQIHFVKEIQQVDTTGVEPLVAIRDETNEAIAEQTIDAHTLAPFFAMEDKVGKNGTIRRRKDTDMVISYTPDSTSTSADLLTDRITEPFHLTEGEPKRNLGDYFFVRKTDKKLGKERENAKEKVVGAG